MPSSVIQALGHLLAIYRSGGAGGKVILLIQAGLLPCTDPLGPKGIAMNLSTAAGAYVIAGPELGAEG